MKWSQNNQLENRNLYTININGEKSFKMSSGLEIYECQSEKVFINFIENTYIVNVEVT